MTRKARARQSRNQDRQEGDVQQRLWIVAVVAVVVAGLLMFQEHTSATSAVGLGNGGGIPGGVAFNTMRDGNPEIHTMNADGTGLLRITEHPATDVDPAISPNGRDIVFTSNRSGNNDVFVVDSEGGTAVNLTNNAANDGWRDGRRTGVKSSSTATGTATSSSTSWTPTAGRRHV